MLKILLVIGVIVLVFGVPFLIDLLFRSPYKELTVFKASEILSYYGSILGAGIALIISVLTIQFTRKQIKRQAYVDREKEKWTKIENIFADIITRINPLNLMLITVSKDMNDIKRTADAIDRYRLDCKISTDVLISYLNRDEDYPKVKDLAESIMSAGELFNNASQELCEEYLKLGSLRRREMALEMLRSEVVNPGILEHDKVVQYQNIIQQTEGLTDDLILSNIGNTKMKLTRLYENEYRNLFNIKGITFKRIRDEIEKNSFEILDD